MSYRGEQKIKDKIYVYEAIAVWNPEKKRSEQKRIYIGRKDPETGDFIPNKKFYELEAARERGLSEEEAVASMFQAEKNTPDNDAAAEKAVKKESSSPVRKAEAKTRADLQTAVPVSAVEYGRTAALRQLSRSCGLSSVLNQCFPSSARKILDRVITGTGIMPDLTEDDYIKFFGKWIEHCGDQSYISLHEELTRIYPRGNAISQAEPRASTGSAGQAASRFSGREITHSGRDAGLQAIHPQLTVMYGSDSQLPVYMRFEEKETPSMQDLITGFAFLRPLDLLQIRFCFEEELYTDRGLYLLLQHGFRFTAQIPLGSVPAASLLKGYDPVSRGDELTADMGGRHFRIQSRRTVVNGRDVYCHICFDTEQQQLAQASLLHYIRLLEEKVSDGTLQMTDKVVRRYLSFDKRTGDGYICRRKEDVIRDELRYAGCFILLSNAEANAIRALKGCLDREDIQSVFDRPVLRPRSAEMNGGPVDPYPAEQTSVEMFVCFLRLILQAYLRRKIQNAVTEGRLDNSCTTDQILSELAEVRRISYSDGTRSVTGLTQRQEAICEALGVKL